MATDSMATNTEKQPPAPLHPGHPTPSPERPTPLPHHQPGWTVWRSIATALGGVKHTLRHERNARIELGIAATAVLLGLLLGFTALEWAILALLIVTVLALEMMNTALEAVVDLVSPDHHPLAKVAKDTAAGAVVLGAVGSLVVALFLFGPRLWALLQTLLAG